MVPAAIAVAMQGCAGLEMSPTAIVPDYALGPHTASLGLTSSQGESLSPQFAHGMFVGQHGSWNRNPPSGYKVIFVPFEAQKLNRS